MKPFSVDLSIADEIQAVADFIGPRWEPIDNLVGVITSVQQAAFHDGRAAFDGLEVSTFVSDLMRRREAVVAALFDHPVEKSYAPMHDSMIQTLSAISLAVNDYAEAALKVDGKWDFPRQVRSAQIHAQRISQKLSCASPLGWSDFKARNERGEVDIDYSYKQEKAAFTGTEVITHRSPLFVEQVSLSGLAYSDSQGRNPSYSLISAIYAHFSQIKQNLVTHEIKVELDKLAAWDLPEIGFAPPVLNKSDNLMVALLLSKTPSFYDEAEFRRSVSSRIEFDAKPEHERKAIMMANREKTMASMKDTMKSIDVDIELARNAAVKSLRKAFGTEDENSSLSM